MCKYIPINFTGLLYGHVTAVPVYLPDLKLSPAQGIKNYSEQQWLSCKRSMDELVLANDIKFKEDFGNPSKHHVL